MATEKSISRADAGLEQGLSCGEYVLLASNLKPGPQLDTLLSATRGLAAGRAGVCDALLAGLMILGVANPDAAPQTLPGNDFLGAFTSPGAPGSSTAQRIDKANVFRAWFMARSTELGVNGTCANASDVDWSRNDPQAVADGVYPPEGCRQLTREAITKLNELLKEDGA